MPKRKPSLTVAYVRNKVLWPLFSQYIRLKYADEEGMVHCVTCQTKKHWKKLQAGHFIPGRFNSILFEERGVHPQCYHCNVGLKGNPREYDRFMRMKYGQDTVIELDKLAKKVVQFDMPTLLKMVGEYKDKVEKLKEKLI